MTERGRPGGIGEFDAVDELAGWTRIVQPVSVPEAEQLLPTLRLIRNLPAEEIGLLRLEVVQGPKLVAIVRSDCAEATRALFEGWHINCEVSS